MNRPGRPRRRTAGPAFGSVIVDELWTSRQRQASSIHEISYRACFKPQLPRFFIERCSAPGDLVYDPFMGRGTTIVEAALMGRRVAGNDANPLSKVLTLPRLRPPGAEDVEKRLSHIPFFRRRRADIDLSMFFHRETEGEIMSLREYLFKRAADGEEDSLDRWIRMVATNRLTGHSKGFFSVYTLPPNQATSADRQRKINLARGQRPPYRDVRALILQKTGSLLSSLSERDRENLFSASKSARFFTSNARRTPRIRSGTVRLTVTSPPFLDIVQYAGDNWLRCWFNGIDAERVGRSITVVRTLEEWSSAMAEVMKELYRITAKGGYVAFEVGEVRNGTVALEEHVLPLGVKAGFVSEALFVNSQSFTKTANIWGISNNRRGTNSNRILLFRKR